MRESSKRNWRRRLLQIFTSFDGRGSFVANGVLPNVLPGLEVNGVGSIGLPLSAEQAIQLREQCEQAGYGKGEQTIVNTQVRRVWRMTPDRFELTNPEWTDTVSNIVACVQQELGLEDQKVSAHLYDLLLYERGGFFLPHKDGEKLDRMVATLVIVLPSKFMGGDLVVRHEGEERVIDFSSSKGKFAIQYAAFYADCEHEVKPLTEGHRLCLVYNLAMEKKGTFAKAPLHLQDINNVATILREWTAQGDEQKIALTLEHQYTRQGISWEMLKGADATRARILADAAKAAGCRAYLALLTFWQSGGCEAGYDEYYSRRRRRYGYSESDEDDSMPGERTMSEIYDSSLSAEHWLSPDGTIAAFGNIPIEAEEILPEGSLTTVTPEEDFQGYTGNEGMTLERWYRRAAIVLWPETRHFEVLCSGGVKQAVPALLQLVAKAKKAEPDQAEVLTKECRQFTEQIVTAWPKQDAEHFGSRFGENDEGLLDPIAAIAFLDDLKLLRSYLRHALVQDGALQPAKSLTKILAAHGWTPCRSDLITTFKKTDVYTLARNAELLYTLCSAAIKPGKSSVQDSALDICREIAEIALQSLIRIDIGPADPSAWRVRRNELAILGALVKSLLNVDAEDSLAALAVHVMGLPDRYSLQQTLSPMLVDAAAVVNGKKRPASTALSDWIRKCQQQLELLTTNPPQPPADFRREANVSCKCADCAELRRFLSDPDESDHRFQMPQRRRDHLADQIRHSHCDLDCTTDRHPRPQVLVCKKNTATHQQLLKEYRENLNHLFALRACE
jgi:predicted 2-oxoglutarate/Fe(II)-dependent dioxygenase YbiX